MQVRTLVLCALLGLGECLSMQALPRIQRKPHQRLIELRMGLVDDLLGRSQILVGDQIVAGNDWNSSSPAYGIVRAQKYELRRVYFQGVVDGKVERVDVDSLEEGYPAGCEGLAKYISLFSSRYHDASGPVILRPNEVEIVRVRDVSWRQQFEIAQQLDLLAHQDPQTGQPGYCHLTATPACTSVRW